jgi:hypothetical protein
MQKGKGKALRSFSLALFSLVLKQDSANRMEAYYTARHLWEEAAKRLKGQIKGQTEKKKSETLRFQTSQWQREKDSNSDSGVFITFSHIIMCKSV